MYLFVDKKGLWVTFGLKTFKEKSLDKRVGQSKLPEAFMGEEKLHR